MTVSAMRDSMGQDEFMRWGVYHARKAQKQQLAELQAKAKAGR